MNVFFLRVNAWNLVYNIVSIGLFVNMWLFWAVFRLQAIKSNSGFSSRTCMWRSGVQSMSAILQYV